MEYSGNVLNAGEPLASGSASHAPRPRGLLLAALVAGLVWAGACTTSPSATGEAGAWAGTVVSTPFGNGTLVLTLTDTNSTLGGTWTLSYPNTADNNSGSLVWTLNGSAITLTLTPNVPVPASCVYNLTGTVTNTTSMSGSYATVNCTLADSGSFSATLGG
jgi:hypothetical protein